MNNPALRKVTNFFADNLFYFIIVPLTAYLIYYAIATLQWRIDHDLSVFTYMAYLINDLGFVPYRDIFEVQVPGTFFIYSLFGWISGYSDLGLRIIDLVYLVFIMLGTWLILRKIDSRIALAAPILFALLYLGLGPKMSLEREYLILPGIIYGLLLARQAKKLHYLFRSFLIGFLFGLTSSLKPQTVLGMPVVLTYLVFFDEDIDCKTPGVYFGVASFAILGLILPWLISLYYLWYNGAFFSFIDIAMNYWPLYRDLGAGHVIHTGFSTVLSLMLSFRNFGGFGIWVIVAIFGSVLSLTVYNIPKQHREFAYFILAFAAVFYIYPVIGGHFALYLWIPFLYFITILASLSFLRTKPGVRQLYKLIPIVVFTLACFISLKLPFGGFRNIYGDYEKIEPWGGRADEIGLYLSENLEPGDKVQPLDWICGAAHGLLIAKAPLATKHLYDFDFYHHISEDYIRNLREDFIRDLRKEKPRFIVEVPFETFTRCHGPDTTTEFPELREIIDNDYIEVASGDGYIIYECVN